MANCLSTHDHNGEVIRCQLLVDHISRLHQGVDPTDGTVVKWL